MANTLEIRKQIKTNTVKEDFVDSYKLFIADQDYETVTKNSLSTEYKIFVMDYDTDKVLVGYKKFVQYPYDSQVFFVGDYIVRNSENWLVFALDNQYTYNTKGKIKKCNNLLKWKDSDGNIRSYSVVIEDKINNSDLDQNKHLIVPEGGIIVHCQQNSYTENLGINKRFILSGQAFKINQVINYSSDTIMTFIMQWDNLDINDDLINGIANNNLYDYTLQITQDDFSQQIGYTTTLTATVEYNDEVVDKNIEWISSDITKAIVDINGNLELLDNGSVVITSRMVDNNDINDTITITITGSLPSDSDTIITPDEYTILQGKSQTYYIYKYVDNVQQADTFNIVASNVPSDYYTISTTNNSFTITNLKSYTINDLLITCTNNITSGVTTKNIKLKGFW